MKTVKVTTDWHLGVKRVAGVTPKSQADLTEAMCAAFERELDRSYDHLIAGDLFDQFTVDSRDVLRTFMILADYLKDSVKTLCIVRGNHDHSPRAGMVSSFDLLTKLLESQFGDQVVVAREVTHWRDFVLVPHLANNEILKTEVARLSGERNKVFVFHANFDNGHAADSEHSLNVTREMADSLLHSGNVILFGHEHGYRNIGDITCLGNTFPSSISDVLHGPKFSWLVGDTIERAESWHPSGSFADIDWRHLVDVSDDLQFIRVSGHAAASEAAEVISAIARLRQRHSAFVISNAVKIEGMEVGEAVTALEQVSNFDVLSALLETLSAEEGAVVKCLLEEDHA